MNNNNNNRYNLIIALNGISTAFVLCALVAIFVSGSFANEASTIMLFASIALSSAADLITPR